MFPPPRSDALFVFNLAKRHFSNFFTLLATHAFASQETVKGKAQHTVIYSGEEVFTNDLMHNTQNCSARFVLMEMEGKRMLLSRCLTVCNMAANFNTENSNTISNGSGGFDSAAKTQLTECVSVAGVQETHALHLIGGDGDGDVVWLKERIRGSNNMPKMRRTAWCNTGSVCLSCNAVVYRLAEYQNMCNMLA